MEAPILSDKAWKFMITQGGGSDGEFFTFEGDYGNWNWLFAKLFELSVGQQNNDYELEQTAYEKGKQDGVAEAKKIMLELIQNEFCYEPSGFPVLSMNRIVETFDRRIEHE